MEENCVGRNVGRHVGRTVRYSNTYFQNAPFEWNLLENDTKNSTSISEFKRKLLALIRPKKNSVYGINDIVGVRHFSKLRLNFSGLNEHRFRHNFDCLDPVCLCGIANEKIVNISSCTAPFLKKLEEISLSAYPIFLGWIWQDWTHNP